MLISELAKLVHENAVAHGWWEEEREPPEINALIHSEWSEGLEEARAGMPLAYIVVDVSTCPQIESHKVIVERDADGRYILNGKEYHGKPEGVAVELIDGCIRILDYMGYLEAEIGDDGNSTIESLYITGNTQKVPDTISELIAYLHLYTSQAIASRSFHDLGVPDIFALLGAMAAALSWVKKQGLDPLAILMEKHEYNKTRPYKHGKKF